MTPFIKTVGLSLFEQWVEKYDPEGKMGFRKQLEAYFRWLKSAERGLQYLKGA